MKIQPQRCWVFGFLFLCRQTNSGKEKQEWKENKYMKSQKKNLRQIALVHEMYDVLSF